MEELGFEDDFQIIVISYINLVNDCINGNKSIYHPFCTFVASSKVCRTRQCRELAGSFRAAFVLFKATITIRPGSKNYKIGNP